jgi:uncharacterized Zn-binding protein involved in type VI secretion
MPSVGVNPPKTPVTEGSGDKAIASVPNVCKMPGPPAPFVPTPLPNIGQSSDNLDECTSTVLFEGKKVAIRGTTYKSKLSGDLASKATGGGVVSSTEEGTTAFAAPGSMNVKAEGKNIQLLGDAMLNNGGSTPYNAAAPSGNLQGAESLDDIHDELTKIAEACNDAVNAKDGPANAKNCRTLGTKKHKCCEDAINKAKNPKVASEQPYDNDGTPSTGNRASAIAQGSTAKAAAKAAGVVGKALSSAFLKGFNGIAGFFATGVPPINLDAVVFRVGVPPGAVTESNMQKIFDFKFPCTNKKKGSGDTAEMSAGQLTKYQNAFPNTDIATIVVRSI